MKALIVERKISRFAAARMASAFGAGKGAGIGPLRLTDTATPKDRGAAWVGVTPILSGVCGSDLSTVDGRSSHYFEHIVSFPFIPGHEILGLLNEASLDAHGIERAKGQRVVIQPVLNCIVRGETPCAACQKGDIGRCQILSSGKLRAGLQTGYCADTGGGWSEGPLRVHSSQVFAVPDDMSDEDAVTIEPMACALHAALRCHHDENSTIAVLGAGTLGLGVVAALDFLSATKRIVRPRRLIVGARYDVQRSFARAFGADDVVAPDQLSRAVRLATRSLVSGQPTGDPGQLSGGADVVVDAVGSAESLADALKIVAPGGRIVMVGMPGKISIDLASLWHREVEIVGAYAYGMERFGKKEIRTFDLAMELVAHHHTGQLVSAHYPLERFEEALAHAGAAGRRGGIKIVFKPGSSRATNKKED